LESLGIALDAGSAEGAESSSSSTSTSSNGADGGGTDGGGAAAVIDRATLSHLATLSALSLESESIDADALLADVGSMMRCVRSVQDASIDQDVDDIYSGGVMGKSGGGAATAPVYLEAAPLRPDTMAAALRAEDVLRNAAHREGDFFVVPQVLEDAGSNNSPT
jgi:Asp-tRNA(Asn)/Glu-tRNA(Gln) amidotransferase C subunit